MTKNVPSQTAMPANPHPFSQFPITIEKVTPPFTLLSTQSHPCILTNVPTIWAELGWFETMSLVQCIFSFLSQCRSCFYCVTVGSIALQCIVRLVQLWLLVWCWVGSTVSIQGGSTLVVPGPGLCGSKIWLAALHQWVHGPYKRGLMLPLSFLPF